MLRSQNHGGFARNSDAANRALLSRRGEICDRAKPGATGLDERGQARALTIAQRSGVPELLARVLAGRGVEADEVAAYLDPSIKRLMPDPHTLTDMEAASARLAHAVIHGESVAIFGDYDVDGATAAALLARYLRHCGLDPIVHIPDRIFEGYGPNVDAIRSFAERGVKLLVTVDCGTTSHETLAEAKKLGLDVVVIDHHQADEELPPAVAIVNPNRADDLSGLGHLAAVGLVFITLVALTRELRQRNFWTGMRGEPDLLSLLHLVALGTVADVVPLKGLNRAFVAKGLIALRRRDQIGLTALMDAARLSGPPEPWHLGFLLGPRINAGGRIGRADLGVRLLLEEDPSEAARIAAELDRLNRERQQIELATVAQAEAEAMAALGLEEKGAVVVTAARRLASRRGRAGGGAAQGTLRPSGLCDRARAGRHRHRIGALDRRRRSRPGGAARGARGPAAQGRRPRHGGRHHAAGKTRWPRSAPIWRTRWPRRWRWRGARRALAIDGAVSAGAVNLALVRDCWRARDPTAPAIRSRCWRCRRTRSPMPIWSARTTSARASNPATAKSSTPSRSAPPDSRSARRCSTIAAAPMHAAGHLAVDRWQGEERVQMRLTDVAMS